MFNWSFGRKGERKWSRDNIWKDNGWEFSRIDDISQFSDSQSPDKKFPQVIGILENQALVKPRIPSCGSSPFLTRCENTCGSWWGIFFFYRGLFVFLFCSCHTHSFPPRLSGSSFIRLKNLLKMVSHIDWNIKIHTQCKLWVIWHNAKNLACRYSARLFW